MIKGKRILAGLVLALLVGGGLSGAAAFAEEGVDESVQQDEVTTKEVDDPSSEMVEEVEASPPAEEPKEADAGDRKPRRRPAPKGGSGGRAASAAASTQPPEEGQGTVEIDPESAAGACPGGTALKIDNLRSNGTFGPITISDFTNTSFTWTSTEVVSAVLVKDGGGYKTNPGGSSGSASSLGQDISHVIFCLGGDVPDVDAETPEEPCDADGTMPEAEPCVPPPCDGDDTMPGTQPCVPSPCDADDTMPGTQPCVPSPCDADDTMPGRQDCTEDVAGVQSKPEKSTEDTVQGAGLTADRTPAVAPMAAQAAAGGPILPLTGGQLVGFVTVALGLMTAGGGALVMKRPR